MSAKLYLYTVCRRSKTRKLERTNLSGIISAAALKIKRNV